VPEQFVPTPNGQEVRELSMAAGLSSAVQPHEAGASRLSVWGEMLARRHKVLFPRHWGIWGAAYMILPGI
jgi:hypothetical protein